MRERDARSGEKPTGAPSSLVLETTAKERDRWKRWAVDPYIRHPIDPIELTVLLRDFNLQSAEITRLEGELAKERHVSASLVLETTPERHKHLWDRVIYALSHFGVDASMAVPAAIMQNLLRDHDRQSAEIARLEGALAEAQAVTHFANGVTDLAIKHRDEAETREETAREEEREAIKHIVRSITTPDARYEYALAEAVACAQNDICAAIDTRSQS